MLWHQIGTRPSTNTMLTRLRLYCYSAWPMPHNPYIWGSGVTHHHITPIKQAMFERGSEVGNPLFFFCYCQVHLLWLPARWASGFSGDHQQNHQCLWFHSCYTCYSCILSFIVCILLGIKLLLIPTTVTTCYEISLSVSDVLYEIACSIWLWYIKSLQYQIQQT